MQTYTACYTKTETGYTGQLLEWPDIISEGVSIDECREMLEDATREMIAVYREDGLPIALRAHHDRRYSPSRGLIDVGHRQDERLGACSRLRSVYLLYVWFCVITLQLPEFSTV